jgi:hypothetical protein
MSASAKFRAVAGAGGVRMGRHPDPRSERIRADWVYVGTLEAAALAGVAEGTVNRWISGGRLQAAVEVIGELGGRPRKLYRLDRVLALVNDSRR